VKKKYDFDDWFNHTVDDIGYNVVVFWIVLKPFIIAGVVFALITAITKHYGIDIFGWLR
jgi:hypothetical protein